MFQESIQQDTYSGYVTNISAWKAELNERQRELEEKMNARGKSRNNLNEEWKRWAEEMLTDLSWKPKMKQCSLRFITHSPPEVSKALQEVDRDKKVVKFGGSRTSSFGGGIKFVFKPQVLRFEQVSDDNFSGFLTLVQDMNVSFTERLDYE